MQTESTPTPDHPAIPPALTPDQAAQVAAMIAAMPPARLPSRAALDGPRTNQKLINELCKNIKPISEEK